MAAERGSAFLLKVGDGGNPVTWRTVAGLRTTQMSVNGDGVAVTSKNSGGWREFLSEFGRMARIPVGGGGAIGQRQRRRRRCCACC